MSGVALTSPTRRTAYPPGGATLRLVRPDDAAVGAGRSEWIDDGVPRLAVVTGRRRHLGEQPGRRGASPSVRRRRAMLAVAGLCVLGLALPLGGTGGPSHATGSALAGTGHAVEYTVQPGDSLWSIATRADPTGDPRPLVAKLAAQIGSDTVQPGEQIVVP